MKEREMKIVAQLIYETLVENKNTKKRVRALCKKFLISV